MSHPGKFNNYIDGQWVEPRSGLYYPDANPADDGDVIGEFALSGDEDAAAAILSADRAFKSWSGLTVARREAYIERFASLIAENRLRIGEAICREEGKTLKEAMGEPDRGVEECRYFIGEGRRLEGITMPSDRDGVTSVAVRVPLGVIAAITPWNFPFLTPLRKIIPALVTGNTVVFKPASDTPHSGVLIMELFDKAGLPPGVVNMVTGRGGSVGDAITSNPLVHGITFTGSTEVGRRINQIAASHFAKVQLEMGGKNPAIVAGYGDLDGAAAQIAQAAFAVTGQRCTSISRVIVLREEAAALTGKIAERMKSYVLGGGMDPKVTMGPLINRQAGEKVIGYIDRARTAGATVHAVGRKLSANRTAYGLAASLFTDSCMPFGGVKNSGLGAFSKGATNKDFFTTWKVNYTKYV